MSKIPKLPKGSINLAAPELLNIPTREETALNNQTLEIKQFRKEVSELKEQLRQVELQAAIQERKSRNFQWVLGIVTTIIGAILGALLSMIIK